MVLVVEKASEQLLVARRGAGRLVGQLADVPDDGLKPFVKLSSTATSSVPLYVDAHGNLTTVAAGNQSDGVFVSKTFKPARGAAMSGMLLDG